MKHFDETEKNTGRKLNVFEKYLTLWVFLCIIAGIILGKAVPGLAASLDRWSIYQVSIPIAVCLFFMMYPIMVKIDFAEVIKAGKTPKPVVLTLILNWAIKPFTMFFIAAFFLTLFYKLGLITGTEVVKTGQEVELYRSYISGAILLGIAPCTAMVLVWTYLAKANIHYALADKSQLTAVESYALHSLFKTLAHKHKVSATQKRSELKQGSEHVLYYTHNGKQKILRVFKLNSNGNFEPPESAWTHRWLTSRALKDYPLSSAHARIRTLELSNN